MNTKSYLSMMLALAMVACGDGPTVTVELPTIIFPAPPADVNVTVNVTTASTATAAAGNPEPTPEEPEVTENPSLGITENAYSALRGRTTEVVCGEINLFTPVKLGLTTLNLSVMTSDNRSGRAFSSVAFITEGGSRNEADISIDGLVLFGRGGRVPFEIGAHTLTLYCTISTVAEPGRYEVSVNSASGFNLETGEVVTVDTNSSESVFNVQISALVEIGQGPTIDGFVTNTIPGGMGTRGTIGRLVIQTSEELLLTQVRAQIISTAPYPLNWVNHAVLQTPNGSYEISREYNTMDMWFHARHMVGGTGGYEIEIVLETNSRGVPQACYTLNFPDALEARTREGYEVRIPFAGANSSVFCDRD